MSTQAPLEAKIAAEFVTLPAAFLELATRRATHLVDLARMLARLGAKVHARARGRRREGQLAEVARLQPLAEVLPADPLPSHEILRRHENATVVPRPAAGAALQAIKLGVGG